jgi:phosphoglycerate dehydrogenase-like enzyme
MKLKGGGILHKEGWDKVNDILVLLNEEAMDAQRETVCRLLMRNLPESTIHFAASPQEVKEIQQVDVIIAPTLPWLPEVLDMVEGTRWVHFLGSGVDPIWKMRLHERDLLMSNSAGVHANPIAEWVMGAILYFVKDLGKYHERAKEKTWDRDWAREISGSCLGIVGLGRVGQEIARKAKAFDMQVIGTIRTPREIDYADKVYPSHHIDLVVEAADYLAVVVPLTSETYHLLDHHRLRRMRPNSILLNASRGGVVDELALAHVLQDRRIQGAAIDVFEEEPLPEESPLWGLPNVLLTPHIAGTTQFYMDRAIGIFLENLRSLRATQELVTEISTNKGY